jgi:hypothetical protein
MTIGVLPNPTGAGFYDGGPSVGNQHISVEVDTATSLPLGTLVEIEPYAGPGTGNPPTLPKVQASGTSNDNYVVGVLTGGKSVGLTTAIGPGAVGVVAVEGICQVLCDANNTTAGYPLIQSTTTAGTAKCTSAGAAPTAGLGIGVCLQSVTISSGTALVWAYIHKV